MKKIISFLITAAILLSNITTAFAYTYESYIYEKQDRESINLSYLIESITPEMYELDGVTSSLVNASNTKKLYDGTYELGGTNYAHIGSNQTRYAKLHIKFKEEISFNKVLMFDMGANTVAFTFEKLENSEWVPFFEYNRVGEQYKYCYFPTETLSEMRINVTDITTQNESSYFTFLLTEIEFYNISSPDFYRLQGMIDTAESFLNEAENSGKPYYEDRINELKAAVLESKKIVSDADVEPYEAEEAYRFLEDKYYNASRYLNYPREEYEKVIYNYKNFATAANEEWTDEQIESFDKTIDSTETIWKTMIKDDSTDMLWESIGTVSDLKAKNNSNDAGKITSNLRKMAVAATHKYSRLKGNPELISDIEYGMDKFFKYYFGEGIEWFGTSCWNYIIGFPKGFGQTSALMYDVLPEEKILYYCNQLYSQLRPDYVRFSGTNCYDTAYGAALFGAILGYDYLISNLYDKLYADLIVKDTLGGGDGYYDDNSYIFHTKVPYAGTYGISGYKYFNSVFTILKGTSWIGDTDAITEYMTNVSINVYLPRLINDVMPFIFNGRATTALNQEIAAGSNVLISLADSGYLFEEPYRTNLLSKVKWLVLNTEADFWQGVADNQNIWRLLNDSSIIPVKPEENSKVYRYEGRVLHRRDDWTMGLSMYAKWLLRFETLNGQNSRGWLINSGATYFWDEDYTHYSDGYMLTADMQRVPGVTAEKIEYPKLNSLTSVMQIPENDYANGVTVDGKYSAAGFETDNYDSELTARKSYFMFDDEVVMLGSSISLPTGKNEVETTVNQRLLSDNNLNDISINGESINSMTVDDKLYENTTYAHMQGRTENSMFGYYFPGGSDVYVNKKTVTNLRKDIDWYSYTNDSTQTETLGTIYLSHGANPVKDTYKYAVLPGKTSEETLKYSENPDFEILAQTDNFHAVREKTLDTVGLVNFEKSFASAGGISVDNKSIAMLSKKSGIAELAISDPTGTEKIINVELDVEGTDIIEKSDRIKILSLSPKVKLEVDVSDAQAEILTLKLKIKGARTGKSIDAFEDIKGHWAFDHIKTAVESGLMNGKSENVFAPDEYITRAEAAVLLTNFKGYELIRYTGDYIDVNRAEWFSRYVAAVSEAGIMKGSGRFFRPLDKLTREEMFKLISVAGELKGKTSLEFTDADKLSGWATAYAKAAVFNGIITGNDKNELNPSGYITRAEAAVIFNRLDTLLNKVTE